eukprot:gb/GFBE01010332.1/.p1 GENE.gb/GFBE01010332.1/~~gb/GFBE01010332.1/.p1  ORF type:complete len:151 (+),score=37.55 gb/GFBE01010332.1/:1-453(+)
MAPRSPLLLPAVLALGAVALLLNAGRSFVAGPAATREQTRIALRAEPEAETKQEADADYKLPKPDMRLMNDASRVGQSFDQDKRGNMWAQSPQLAFKEDEQENPIPAPAFFLFLVVGTIGAIIFFAQLTGQDNRFGGEIGDDQRAIADFL